MISVYLLLDYAILIPNSRYKDSENQALSQIYLVVFC